MARGLPSQNQPRSGPARSSLAVPCEFARIAAMAAFALAIMKMDGPVVSSTPFLLSSGIEISFHLVGGLGINVVTEHK